MRRQLAMIVCFWVGGWIGVIQAQEIPDRTPRLVQVSVKTNEPIMVDGRLDEQAWSETHPISGFRAGGSYLLVPVQTTVKTLWTKEALYVGVQLDESEPSKLRAKCKNRDGEIWWDDCVEFFISPAGMDGAYYHLIVNCNNMVYDAFKRSSAWNGQWSSAVGRNEKGWSMEIRIPFSVLQVAVPKAGEVWRVNYCRNCTPSRGTGSWMNVGQQNYHQPDKFGYLCFGESAEFPVDREVKAMEKSIGNPMQIAVADGWIETESNGKIRHTAYNQELKALVGQLDVQISELKKLDFSKVKPERRQKFDTFAKTYEKYRKESTLGETVSVSDWVTGQMMLGAMSKDMDALYWQIKLDVLYGELSK